jgi:nitrite reductase/ring-hydroxylating ferredoxin subunit
LKTVMAGDEKILVSRLDGKLFACLARCPHAGFGMVNAEVEGTVLSCPFHGWRFDLNEAGSELHGYRGLAMRTIKIENGLVLVAR